MNLSANIEESKSRTDFLWGVFILAVPFAVFYWMLPILGKHTIGNDYVGYWIRQQLYLQFSIKHGTFPLYVPGFAGGWTSSALTLGQLWHPIFWIASLVPGYWSGHAHEIGTALRLFSLGLTHLVIFYFLRRLRLSTVIAFVFSFITVYNLRTLDMFRYGAALENYTAFLLLCVAIGWHFVSPTKRLGPVCIIVCSWLLVIGGHPQIMYLGLLGAGVICLVMPFYIRSVLSEESGKNRLSLSKYYLSVGACVACGVALSSWHLLPYCFEYLSGTMRSDLSFNWACGYQDSIGGSICNFFNPFHSNVHAAFGGSSLILAVVFMPVLYIFRVRVSWSVLLLWILFVVVFFMILGSNGFLYYYFWKYFPFAQNFRVPGRIGILMPILILLVFVWVLRCKAIEFKIGRRQVKLWPITVLAFFGLAAFIILHRLPIEKFKLQESWSPLKINDIRSVTIMFATAAGVVSLLALILYTTQRRLKIIVSIILILAVGLQIGVTLRYGTWIKSRPKKTLTFEDMQQEQREFFSYRHIYGDWPRASIEHFQRTFLEPKMARVCPRYTVVSSRGEAYKGIASKHSIDHVYLENYPKATEVISDKGVSKVELSYNSFNNLKFDVESSNPAFFVFSLPSEYWRAYVNGKRVDIYRANGLEHAVWIEDGQSKVEFRYWSRATLTGMVISCAALLFILIYLSFGIRSWRLRLLMIFAAFCFCSVLYFVWYQSLYHGGNIGTKYTWSSESVESHLSSDNNLAYGKMTAMNTSPLFHYTSASSRGVDGDRYNFGFVTEKQNGAWWQIDLGKVETVREVVLYKHAGKKDCTLPFYVAVSNNGADWYLLRIISSEDSRNYWQIFGNNLKMRYMRIQTRGVGQLALGEVEIYRDKGINLK